MLLRGATFCPLMIRVGRCWEPDDRIHADARGQAEMQSACHLLAR